MEGATHLLGGCPHTILSMFHVKQLLYLWLIFVKRYDIINIGGVFMSKDINVFIGKKDKTIGVKVSIDTKQAVEDRAKELGFSKVTDYILTLIDKDFKSI